MVENNNDSLGIIYINNNYSLGLPLAMKSYLHQKISSKKLCILNYDNRGIDHLIPNLKNIHTIQAEGFEIGELFNMVHEKLNCKKYQIWNGISWFSPNWLVSMSDLMFNTSDVLAINSLWNFSPDIPSMTYVEFPASRRYCFLLGLTGTISQLKYLVRNPFEQILQMPSEIEYTTANTFDMVVLNSTEQSMLTYGVNQLCNISNLQASRFMGHDFQMLKISSNYFMQL